LDLFIDVTRHFDRVRDIKVENHAAGARSAQ
jgi:hypothetical protein